MRKLVVSMNLSLDGFMAGPEQGLDWHLECWTSEMGDELSLQLAKADTIVLGRITFNNMAAYWPARSRQPYHCREEDFVYATMMNTYAKVVFSKTLQQPAWHNTTVARGNLSATIGELKKKNGKDMMVYGSGSLADELIQEGLVDEYQLWIHPVILGKGRSFFAAVQQSMDLKLMNTKTFKTGVVVLYYHSATPV